MLKRVCLLLKKDIPDLKKDIFFPAIPVTEATPDCLAITDSRNILSQCRLKEIPVLFVSGDSSFTDGADYVTEDIVSCDYPYLNLVYCRQKNLPLTILETSRTLLREMTVEDLPELYDIYEDAEIKKYIEPLYPYEEELAYTRDYIKNVYGILGYGLWLVTEKNTGKIMGRACINLREINGETVPELGYLLGREYRGRGVATEVCSSIVDYAFRELLLPQLNLMTEEENTASVRLAKKLKFTLTGDFMQDGRRLLVFNRKNFR